MHQFAGAFAHNSDAQKFVRFDIEQQIQKPSEVTHNLAARDFPVSRLANLISDTRIGQLNFILTDYGNFQNGVDAIRKNCGKLVTASAKACAAAWRPCSIPVDARLGNSATSPTA